MIGLRGSGLQEIFRETECAVEVPPASDPSDIITVRGVEDNIGMAVQAVYARVCACIPAYRTYTGIILSLQPQ